MGQSEFAYGDDIVLDKGHLFWVTAQESSGNIADHYRGVDYNCETDDVREYEKVFSLTVDSSCFYTLSFEKGIKKIGISRYDR